MKKGTRILISKPDGSTNEAVFLSSTHGGNLIHFRLKDSIMCGMVGIEWVTPIEN